MQNNWCRASSRARLSYRGVNQLPTPVRSALGPTAATSSSNKIFGSPTITRTSWRWRRKSPEDPLENMGAQRVREVGEQDVGY